MHDKINEQYDRMTKQAFGPGAELAGSMASTTAAGQLRIQINGRTIGTGQSFQEALQDAQATMICVPTAAK